MTNDFFDRPLVWDRPPSQRIFIEVLKKILEFVGKRLEIPQQSIFVSLIHLVSCCSSVCKRATVDAKANHRACCDPRLYNHPIGRSTNTKRHAKAAERC